MTLAQHHRDMRLRKQYEAREYLAKRAIIAWLEGMRSGIKIKQPKGEGEGYESSNKARA